MAASVVYISVTFVRLSTLDTPPFHIQKHLHAYRQGRLSKNELCGLLHTHRHELLMDDLHEGNVVHGKRNTTQNTQKYIEIERDRYVKTITVAA